MGGHQRFSLQLLPNALNLPADLARLDILTGYEPQVFYGLRDLCPCAPRWQGLYLGIAMHRMRQRAHHRHTIRRIWQALGGLSVISQRHPSSRYAVRASRKDRGGCHKGMPCRVR